MPVLIWASTDFVEAAFGDLALVVVRDEGRLYLCVAEGKAIVSQFVPLAPWVVGDIVRGRSVEIPDLGPPPFELIQEGGVLTFRRGENSAKGPVAPTVRALREMIAWPDPFERLRRRGIEKWSGTHRG